MTKKKMKACGERKVIERERRSEMKGLCFKLGALIPPHFLNSFSISKHATTSIKGSPQYVVDAAASYIKVVAERVAKLQEALQDKKKKRKLNEASTAATYNCDDDCTNSSGGSIISSSSSSSVNDKVPVAELKLVGSGIQVMVVMNSDELLEKKMFLLYQVITILHQEGAQVTNASFSTISDNVFHIIHAQVKIARIGIDTSRVEEKLQELVNYVWSMRAAGGDQYVSACGNNGVS